MEEKYPRQNDHKPEDETEETKDAEKFEREYYEPSTSAETSTTAGWVIAIILFLLAVWLLWIALS